MMIIAQDPSIRTCDGKHILMAKVTVPAETVAPGPRGYRVHVIDYDSTASRFHGAHTIPADYEYEPKSWQAGSPAMIDDYRFPESKRTPKCPLSGSAIGRSRPEATGPDAPSTLVKADSQFDRTGSLGAG